MKISVHKITVQPPSLIYYSLETTVIGYGSLRQPPSRHPTVFLNIFLMGAHLESFKFHSVFFFNGKNCIPQYIKGYAAPALFDTAPPAVPLVSRNLLLHYVCLFIKTLQNIIYLPYVYIIIHTKRRARTLVGETLPRPPRRHQLCPATRIPGPYCHRSISLGHGGDGSLRLKVDPPGPIFN